MANLSVRKLDEDIVSKLRVQAAQHGVSMEEEVRQILKKAVSNPYKLGDLALQYFGENHGVDLETPSYEAHEPLDLL